MAKPLVPGELGFYPLAQESAAVDKMSQVLAGTTELVSNPGLVQALVNGNATVQQSQAIDTFLTGLKAERSVALASQGNGQYGGGTKIALSQDEQNALRAMGVSFDSVLYTKQDALNDYAKHLESTSGATIKRDAQGNVVVQNGILQVDQTPNEEHHHKGWSFGRAFHDVTHNPITGAGGDVLSGVVKGWNVITSGGPPTVSGSDADVQRFMKQQAEAKDAGYDADNPFSMIAFRATGHSHGDTTAIANDWDTKNAGMFGWDGSEAVSQAEKFTRDPKQWRQDILNDPKYKDNPASAARSLQEIGGSQQFHDLVSRVNSEKATIGNTIANTLGIDPVKHPALYNWSAAGFDVAASFALDPTVLAIGGLSNLRKAQLAIHDLTDMNGLARVLDRSTTSRIPILNARLKAQNSVKQFAEHFGPELLKAEAADDTVRMGQLYGQANAANPALAKLLPDIMGKNAIQVHTEETAFQHVLEKDYGGSIDETAKDLSSAREGLSYLDARRLVQENIQKEASHFVGRPIYRAVEKGELPFVYDSAEPLNTYDKLADYIISKNGLMRLSIGRNAIETTLMPGAVSQYGLRALRGNIASWQIGRDIQRGEKITDRLQALKIADPIKFKTLIGEKDLAKMDPQADDAYDLETGARLSPDEKVVIEGLPSQNRALTGTERGLAKINIRRYGTPTIPTIAGQAIGLAHPAAIAARSRLAAARFSNFLPRTTNINLMDASGLEIGNRMARTYLTKGDAALWTAQYALGDGGTRETLIQGLIDQLGNASGMTRTEQGRAMLGAAKTPDVGQIYTHTGNELTINGQKFGLHLGQMRTNYRIMGFGEMQHEAAKVGLISGTLGRFIGNKYADAFGALWRLGALSRPTTAIRAAIESWLNATVKGMGLEGLKSKAFLVEHRMLQGQTFGRTRFGNAMGSFFPTAKVGDFYRHTLIRGMTDEEKTIALEDFPDVVPDMAAQFTVEHMRAEIDPLGANDAGAIARDGLNPALLQFDAAKDLKWGKGGKIREGYRLQPTDGVEGADRYATALAVAVNKSPNVSKAIIMALRNPDDPEGVAGVVRAMDAPEIRNLRNLSPWGKYYWKDGETDGTLAKTKEQVELGKRQLAQAQIDDMKYMFQSRNGDTLTLVQQYILDNNKAPDARWLLDNLSDDNRPTAALAPVFVGKPANGLLGFLNGLTSWEGKFYQWAVERPIQRTTTAPLFGAAYVDEKIALKGFQKQIAEQLGEEAANNTVKGIATQRAWERVALMVDDPQLKSQMDIIGRNFFAFSRATTTMVRRWGLTFYQNPAAARRMMLAWEGAVHSGMVYTDQNGQKMFTFPGSGAMMSALQELMSNVPAFKDVAMYPTADITGKVTQIIPGSANPFQFSMSPVITIPMTKVTQMFPDSHAIWDEINTTMNGQYAAQGIKATLEPTLVRGFFQMEDDTRNGLLSSAMMGTIANLSAAGLVPKKDATSDEQDKFLSRVKDGTRSALFIRAIFAPFLFANPGNVQQGVHPADYPYAVTGAKNLDAEYKEIVDDVGGDLGRAQQIWLALHPDAIAYTVPKSYAAVNKASLPATAASLDWVQQHQGFLKKYKSIGAYFIPPNTTGDPFSMQAYQAQIESGLRVRKTPEEFYKDVRSAGADNQYFAMQDMYHTDKNNALAEGNKQLADILDAKWTEWKRQFSALNPIWADKRAGAETLRLDAQDKLNSLTNMVNANEVPKSMPKAVVSNMIQAYKDYEDFIHSYPGQDDQTLAMHSQAASRFINYMSGVVSAHPEVTSLYNGIFRQLDSNLETVAVITGGQA